MRGEEEIVALHDVMLATKVGTLVQLFKEAWNLDEDALQPQDRVVLFARHVQLASFVSLQDVMDLNLNLLDEDGYVSLLYNIVQVV